MVSCALMRLVGGSNKDLVRQLTYCSLVHDVAFFNNPKLAQIKSTAHFEKVKHLLSITEKELYYRAYNYSFDYASSDRRAPPGAALLINELRQYHMSPNKTEYMISEILSEAACVFIVAHDLTDYILSHPNWTFYEYLENYPFLEYGSVFATIYQNLNRARMAA